MYVNVQIATETARALQERSPPNAESEALLRMIQTFGLTLEPLHRNADDDRLQSHFKLEVPDLETAQRVMNRLQQSSVVEAAYLKPPDELP